MALGDPALEQVRMGALAGMEQRSEVEQAVSRLLTEAEVMYAMESPELLGANAETGAFYGPRILTHARPLEAELVHEVEPFGPVTSLLPYDSLSDAIQLVHRGKGSLCCSIATGDRHGGT